MKHKKLISDNGVVQRVNYIDVVIIVVCTAISIGLAFLGAMAYIVR